MSRNVSNRIRDAESGGYRLNEHPRDHQVREDRVARSRVQSQRAGTDRRMVEVKAVLKCFMTVVQCRLFLRRHWMLSFGMNKLHLED